MRPNYPRKDLSKISGNPTSELEKNYDMLRSIRDPEELAQATINIVKPLVGKGFSKNRYATFLQHLDKARQGGAEGIFRFITMFILAGSGLKVESREAAIASLLTEDVNDRVRLTPHQIALKAMVEKYGYHVGVRTH